jgi:hypothetical protein
MKTQHEIDKRQQEVVPVAATPELFLEWKYEFNEETGSMSLNRLSYQMGARSIRTILKER